MTEQQNKKSNTRSFRIWGTAAVLLVFVILSGVVAVNVFFSETENTHSDALVCITDKSALAAAGAVLSSDNSGTSAQGSNPANSPHSETTASNPDKADISQSQNAWTTTAQIDVFNHGDSHVKTDGTGSANNVIAPGTSHEYTFALQNSENSTVKYSLSITGANDSDYNIPIQLRITNSDGASLTGGDWVELADFDEANDSGVLNSQSENQYTIEWKWEFETGSDDYDTFLGNTAVNEEIPCHINISVIAEYDSDTDSPDSPEKMINNERITNSETTTNSEKTTDEVSSSPSAAQGIISLVTTGDSRNAEILVSAAILALLTIIVLNKMKSHTGKNDE